MKVKHLLIIVIILLLLLLFSLIYYINLPSTKMKNMIVYINNANSINENTILTGSNYLWQGDYIGDITENTVNKSIYYFANDLLLEYKRIVDINDYYKNNAYLIQMVTGVTDINDFEGIVNKAKSLSGNDLELERCDFLEKSVIRTEDGIKGVLAIQYKGNDRLLFTIIIKNSCEKQESPIIYSSYVDESKRTYDISRMDGDNDTITNDDGVGRAY